MKGISRKCSATVLTCTCCVDVQVILSSTVAAVVRYTGTYSANEEISALNGRHCVHSMLAAVV